MVEGGSTRAGGFPTDPRVRALRIAPPFRLALLLLLLAAPAALRWGALRAGAGSAPPGAPIGPLLGEATRLTAGFAEPRSLRLHAGVDFSTNRANGMPVLAPAGGWVSRLAADYTGYGLQLMITDSLGRRHLFAHLSRFRQDLEEELERARQASGTYSQLLRPPAGAFPVLAGEVVAWSGDTGNGPPHLHYELRAADEDRCYNPLRFGLRVPDDLPPRPEGLALVPLDAGARVEGGLFPRRVSPVARPGGGWGLADTLTACGAVGIALHAVDRLPGAESRLPPWRVALMEGRDTLFHLRLDSFPLALNAESGRLFHRWLQQETGRPYLRLWGEGGGMGLWGDAGEEERGRLRPDPARPVRRLELLVWDAAENLARLEWVLRLEAPPPASSVFTADSVEQARLRESASKPAKPRAARKGKRKRSRHSPAPPPPRPEWSLFALDDGLHLRLAPLPAHLAGVTPALLAGRDTLAAGGALRDLGWEWALTLAEEARARAAGSLRVAAAGLKDPPPLTLAGTRLAPDRESTWRDAGGAPSLVIYADKGDVAASTPLILHRWEEPRGVFTLGPGELQFERPLLLELSLSHLPQAERARTALFQVNDKGQPVALVGGTVHDGRLELRLARTGSYRLHADTRGPSITLRKPPAVKAKRRGKRKARWVQPEAYPPQPTLVWEIGGDPSGIANVVLEVGGRRHFPRYEPDTHLVTFRPDSAWTEERADLELHVTDRSGNLSVLRSGIRLSPTR